ncbi:single-stranded-DNA-specific exonuclease RecJ [Paratractidigestivibacter sp.]|uniref:single-stranded-DNA-specific exonuclease RecJ n=1 Tax=Paratractidigestivibacter sp. TaxID=2847316 RepID=UPI002AC942EE|nr:single-stranded-DNA-specific exonuclease RecJ [Paratractidigestivibacter sp.]
MGGLAGSRRWSVLPPDPAAELELSRELGLSSLVARVLAARGCSSAEEARAFLSPSLERDWADPLVIPGMREAADRVERAVNEHEVIAVFGDFDVDGMSSTCLLTLALRRMGAEVHPFIPHRFGEGYGLSETAVGRVLANCEPSLIVTVDNGVAAAAEVKAILDRGIDVVVTDHHEPADLVPQGVPVTDPKLSEDCPSRELAGAGVALKLVHELGRRRGEPEMWRDYTDVAMLGTLSDMMLLQGENRALVAEGIARMKASPRPGVAALAATANIRIEEATADSLPFSIIPRLNAAGRMGTTDVAFDLLMVEDPREARLLAVQLEETNTERRAIESQLTESAMAAIEALPHEGVHAIVVGGEGWHEGVKGIVASRIVNRFHVPAILFSIVDGVARGSGRSAGSVDLFHAVEQCSDCLIRFGGHAGAVGVTCEASRLDEFRDRLEEVLSKLDPEKFVSTEEVAAVIGLDELSVETIASLEALQPFGQGNKKPLFASHGVSMRNRSRVGAEGNHLRFFATDGVGMVPAIMFRAPDPARLVDCDGAVDLVFEAVNETWQGRTKAKLMVKDVLVRGEGEIAAEQGDLASEVAALADDSVKAAPAAGEAPVSDVPDARALEGLGVPELTRELVRRMIGDHDLLPTQQAALDRLAAGRSTMAVMATGRGKSLIFHVHAAREAILEGAASVFVYPLRALVADQSFHLCKTLAELGLIACVLTGETPEDERRRIFAGLGDGAVDIVLTTPEFLAIHTGRFSECGRVRFVVVDEAHHAGASKAGHRSAYQDFPRIREELGEPVCLAVTATATAEASREICRLLGVVGSDVLVDDGLRENLAVVDRRNIHDRESALVSLVSSGEKTIVYVTSRQQSVEVVRLLRHRLPDLAGNIAFYNAGLPRDVRARVEGAFRAGELTCIVSTSAFGEGVNLPDVRNVVLYTLPFGRVEFNQMSGRAGRDGLLARVHLLFGGRDVRLNEKIIAAGAPERPELVVLWRSLVALDRSCAEDTFALDKHAVIAMAAHFDATRAIDESEIEGGLGVFSELGFLSVEGFGDARRVRMAPSPEHMDLELSVRYREGLQGREDFGQFCDWVLHCSQEELTDTIARPISPSS